MKVIIACGGSGGHIFPAVALAQALHAKGKNYSVEFIASDKALDRRILDKEGVNYSLLSGNKLPNKISPAALMFPFKLFFDVVRSFGILVKSKPQVVVGFGGYISVPVIFTAYILGIPRIIHEQNVIPGRANVGLFAIADRIAISFEETKKYLGRHAYKAVFTGNPIRITLLKSDRVGNIKKMGLDSDKFNILVIGGSQGAHNLNKAFLKVLSQLEGRLRSSLQVIHITGHADYGWASEAYKELGVESRVYSFIDKIEEAYSVADLVVTRSGASAIFEIAYFGKPMVLIPYPFAMKHQSENARIFSKKGAAIQIDEKELSAPMFRDSIINLLNDRKRLTTMAESARQLSMPDSSYALAEEVVFLYKGSQDHDT